MEQSTTETTGDEIGSRGQVPGAREEPSGPGPWPLEPGPSVADAENRGIVRAAAVLAVGNVASRVLGLAREMVKANLFGTTPLLAAFQACLLYTSRGDPHHSAVGE